MKKAVAPQAVPDVEQPLAARAEKVDGEDAVLGRGEGAEALLEGVGDAADDKEDDKGNGAAVAPRPLGAAKGVGHDEKGVRCRR